MNEEETRTSAEVPVEPTADLDRNEEPAAPTAELGRPAPLEPTAERPSIEVAGSSDASDGNVEGAASPASSTATAVAPAPAPEIGRAHV